MADNVNIDTIYEMLEEIEAEIEWLDRQTQEYIEPYSVRAVSDAILVIDGLELGPSYPETAPARLSISRTTLNKFLKMEGRVELSTARKVADRVRTFIRSLDQTTASTEPAPLLAAPKRARKRSFKADTWAVVVPSSEIKQKIVLVSELLDSIVSQLDRANLSEGEQVLTKIEREQLIATLRTTLKVLEAPMVERGLLRRTGRQLKKISERAFERQVQEGLGNVMREGSEKITSLLEDIWPQL